MIMLVFIIESQFDLRIWKRMSRFCSQNFLLTHMNLHKLITATLSKITFLWSFYSDRRRSLTIFRIQGLQKAKRLVSLRMVSSAICWRSSNFLSYSASIPPQILSSSLSQFAYPYFFSPSCLSFLSSSSIRSTQIRSLRAA